MVTTPTISGPNTFQSRIAGFTVSGRAHDLSAWFVLALRLMMGVAFFTAGFHKLTEGGWTATGYLLHAVPAASPLHGVFVWMGSTPWFASFLAVAVPYGEFAIGLGLIFGVLTRLAAFFGAFMMLMFYFGNWTVENGLINGDLAYVLVFLSVAAFGAGRILGLDPFIEGLLVRGRPLIERYPALEYVLG